MPAMRVRAKMPWGALVESFCSEPLWHSTPVPWSREAECDRVLPVHHAQDVLTMVVEASRYCAAPSRTPAGASRRRVWRRHIGAKARSGLESRLDAEPAPGHGPAGARADST